MEMNEIWILKAEEENFLQEKPLIFKNFKCFLLSIIQAKSSVCLSTAPCVYSIKCKKYYTIGVDTLRLKWYYKQVVSNKTTTNLENWTIT